MDAMEKVEGVLAAAGFRMDASTRELVARYQAGEISLDEAVAQAIDRAKKQENLSA